MLFQWRSPNDAALDGYLRQLTGPVFSSKAGTPELKIADKEYSITCQAIDFLGATSDIFTFRLFKSTTPTPQIVFTPPSLSVTRDQEALVLGEALFSSCPADLAALSFSWNQVEGPTSIPAISENKIPQLRIAPNSLQAGAAYKLRLSVSLPGSAPSVAYFIITTGYQPLFATIAGGSSITASSSFPLTLSASASRDPDVPQNEAQNLQFVWTCTTVDAVREVACRDAQGGLLSLGAGSSELVVPPLMASDAAYFFTVTVNLKP